MSTKHVGVARILIVAVMAGVRLCRLRWGTEAHCTYGAGAAGRPGLDIVAVSLERHHGG